MAGASASPEPPSSSSSSSSAAVVVAAAAAAPTEAPKKRASQLKSVPRARPAKSVEGWVIFVTGLHEEACEDDVVDAFGEFGSLRSVTVNLDRQTGATKGYGIVEYEKEEEARAAITGMNGKELLGQVVRVTWAFSLPPRRYERE